MDSAISSIKEWSTEIESGRFPHTNKSYGELQQELNTAAANLHDASSDVVVSVHNPTELAYCSKEFSSAFHDLLTVSNEFQDCLSEMFNNCYTVQIFSKLGCKGHIFFNEKLINSTVIFFNFR